MDNTYIKKNVYQKFDSTFASFGNILEDGRILCISKQKEKVKRLKVKIISSPFQRLFTRQLTAANKNSKTKIIKKSENQNTKGY